MSISLSPSVPLRPSARKTAIDRTQIAASTAVYHANSPPVHSSRTTMPVATATNIAADRAGSGIPDMLLRETSRIRSASATTMTPTGTLMRKIQCHSDRPVISPPSAGPRMIATQQAAFM